MFVYALTQHGALFRMLGNSALKTLSSHLLENGDF